MTAWDGPDGELLSGLLGSIAAVGAAGRAIRVLVPGVAEVEAVRRTADALDVESVPIGGGEGGFPARLAETMPLLPQIVHGFARYIWIDPTIWLAGDDAFAPYDQGAETGALAAAYELDRGYRILSSSRTPWRAYRLAFDNLFGEAVGRRMSHRPIVNTGMFALAGDAPHWLAWRETFAVLDRAGKAWADGHLSSHQLALNFAIVRDRLPVTPLPALWNWLCHWERPCWDGARLVEPQPPHAPIRVIHLSGRARRTEMEIAGARDGTFRSSLRFPLVVDGAPRAA